MKRISRTGAVALACAAVLLCAAGNTYNGNFIGDGSGLTNISGGSFAPTTPPYSLFGNGGSIAGTPLFSQNAVINNLSTTNSSGGGQGVSLTSAGNVRATGIYTGNGSGLTNIQGNAFTPGPYLVYATTNVPVNLSGNGYQTNFASSTDVCFTYVTNGPGSFVAVIRATGGNINILVPTAMTNTTPGIFSAQGTNSLTVLSNNCIGVFSFLGLVGNFQPSNVVVSAWTPASVGLASGGGSGITALTGDVTASGTGSVAATVALVAGSSAANVHAAELLANAATSANTASTIVKRDASGAFIANGINITNIPESSIQWSNSAVLSAVTNYAVTYGTSWVNFINPPDTNICFSSFVGTQGSCTFVIPQSRSNVWVLFPTNFYGNIVGPTNLFTMVGTNFMLAKSSPKSVMTIQFIASTNITSNPNFTNQSIYISDTGSPQSFNGTFTGSFSGNGAGMTNLNYYRAGQQNITSLSTSQAVTFSSSLPNTNYAVSVLPDSTLAAAIGFGVTSKTTSGFTITLSAGITGATTVDWTATPNQ